MATEQTGNYFTSEIDKFNQHADAWWQLEGSFRTLHHINPQRIEFIERYFGLEGKRILDVGCGGGILSEAMAEKGATVLGIDINESAIDAAKQHQNNSHIDYQVITVESLSEQKKGMFDAITCMDMLEHVPDPASIITACAKLLKPNGDLFFCTLNRNIKSYLFGIIGAEYLLNLVPRGTHDYKQFIRPSELASWCRDAHLEVAHLAGLRYIPWQQRGELTNNVDINYLLHAKQIGNYSPHC
jgi:2-polyprenyl-6-hydroxyphenyl methylase / 3-demethylubiquinone-9 3-methyltransferase